MIEIKGLSCGYGEKLVLKDIDLSVKKGQIVGIIGPNGSGKTTILKAITRLVHIVKGRIFLDGADMKHLNANDIARSLAVVSQTTPSLPMTVKEFVLLGRIPYYKKFQFFENGNDNSIAERAMELTRITHLKDAFMSEMSAGEVQLAFIARGLAQEPKILLLDEPTSHLDITHQVGILDLVRRLNRQEGLTVVIILHDLNLASEYCDTIALIDNGRVKKFGQPAEVLNYKIIEEVYKTVVIVRENPLSGKPFVLIVPEEVKEICQKGS